MPLSAQAALPNNIETVVRSLSKWTVDWLPERLGRHGFLKSATMLTREFDIYGAYIEQRPHYDRRRRCGLCGNLIDHGHARIEIWANNSRRSFFFHHSQPCR